MMTALQELVLGGAARVEAGSASLAQAATDAGLTVEAFQGTVGELLALRNRFQLNPLPVEQQAILRAVQQMAPLGSEVSPLAAAGAGLATTEAGSGALATVAGWFGISVGALAVGALAVGALAIGGVVWYRSHHDGAPATELAVPGPPPPCPRLAQTARLCPWSPRQADARPCGPGFCWDGGFTGSLACKQEQLPVDAVRGDLSGARCKAGFEAETDRCTHVLTACVPR